MSEELKNLQHKLKNNEDAKRFYIEASDVEEDDESHCGNEVKLSLKKKNTKKRNINTKGDINMILFEQFMNKQEELNKTNIELYQLKTELDVEEVKTRYVRLELNNAQVDLEEKKRELGEMIKYKKKYQIQLFFSVLFFVCFIFTGVLNITQKYELL